MRNANCLHEMIRVSHLAEFVPESVKFTQKTHRFPASHQNSVVCSRSIRYLAFLFGKILLSYDWNNLRRGLSN